VHDRGHEHRANDERVEEDGAGQADAEQLDPAVGVEDEPAEDGDDDDGGGGDDAARIGLADGDGVMVLVAGMAVMLARSMSLTAARSVVTFFRYVLSAAPGPSMTNCSVEL
jgi:hypothetical protein